MSTLKITAISFCTFLILAGFILKILPRSTLDKNVKTTISLVLLLILIAPIMKLTNYTESEIVNSVSSAPQIVSQNQDIVYIKAVEEFKNRVETELENSGFNYTSVNISYTKTNNTIAINKITITVKDVTNKQKIENHIYNKFLAPVTVIKDG